METIYLVMEQGFDYNDEYFFQVDGGHPDSFFTDREAADAHCAVKNLEEFKRLVKEGYIRDYSSDGLDGLLSDKATEDDLLFDNGIFKTLFGLTAEDWYEAQWNGRVDDKLKVEPTEEQWKKLMSCFNLEFYDVVTVQKGQ